MRISGRFVINATLVVLVLAVSGSAAPPKHPTTPPQSIEGTEIRLGGTIQEMRTGGAGRYLIFRLKNSDKLILVDTVEPKLLNSIPTPGDFQFAADRDKLMLILNGQRIVQRWDLKTQEREKSALLSDDRPVRLASMGDAGQGPLALWHGAAVSFLDADSLKPLEIQGKVIDIGGNLTLWPSADGLTFASYGWTTGQVQLMRLDHVTPTSANCTVTASNAWISYNMAWAFPGPDGKLLISHDGDNGLFVDGMRGLDITQFKGAVLYPTEDPRFLLALRRDNPYDSKGNAISIVASGDRRILHTLHDMEPVTGGQIGTQIGRINTEPRVRYLPVEKLLICIPDTDDRVLVHPFDLKAAMGKSGADFLFVISLPQTQLRAKQAFSYQIEVLSNAAVLKYKLDDGPEGMSISAGGKVTWTAPADPKKEKVPVIVTVTDEATGTEATHAFELTFPPPPIKTVVAGADPGHPDAASAPQSDADAAIIKRVTGRLAGEWLADVALDDLKLRKMLKAAGPESQTPEAMDKLKQSLLGVKMILTLRNDGSGETAVLGLGGAAESIPLKWEVVAASEANVVSSTGKVKVKLTDKNGVSSELELQFVAGALFVTTLPDERVYPLRNTLAFRRAPRKR